MHCTSFGEDNGKLGTQFRLRLEHSNVELQIAYRIEWVTQQRRRYLATDEKVQSAQNKSTLGVE